MSGMLQIIETINHYAWGVPMVVLLVGTGLYLTFKLRFIQVRYFGQGFKQMFGGGQKDQKGDVSRFHALTAELAGTIGTGNIAGVATAITMGGPGAIFWMWVTALVGMATKFVSCTLGVHFRQVDKYGRITGGPMYTLKYGLNMPVIGTLFAAFTLIATFGIGNTVQANSIASGVDYIFPSIQQHLWILGIVLATMVGVVVLGGIQRIGHVAGVIVPVMGIAYCIAALVIVFMHVGEVPHAIVQIFNLALNPHAVAGGGIGAAMQYGVARGVFSNEAGLGSAAIAHAAAKTDNPVKQGLVAMLGPFIDTIVVCTMTALVIVIVGHDGIGTYQGAALSAYAFQHGLASLGIGNIGAWVVGFGLIFFAYSTMITWCYYGDRCAEFIFGIRAVLPYRILFTLLVVVGTVAPLHVVWQFADLANILMAIPNLICVILLASMVKKLTFNAQGKLQLQPR